MAQDDAVGDLAAFARRLELVDDAVVEWDADWRFVYLNRRAAQMVGSTPEQLLGRKLFDVLPQGRGSVFHRGYEQARRTGEVVEIDAYSQVVHGWFRARAHPHGDHLTVVLKEVTEERRLALLGEVRAALSVAYDPALGPRAQLRVVAAALRQATGFELAELWIEQPDGGELTLTHVDHDRDDPDARRFGEESGTTPLGDDSQVFRALASGAPVRTVDPDQLVPARAAVAKATGMRRAIHLPIPSKVAPNAVIGLFSRLPDGDDERLLLLEELHPEIVRDCVHQRDLHDLQSLFTLSRDILVVARAEGHFVRVNPAMSRLLGHTEEELLEHPFTTWVHPDDVPDTDEVLTQQVEGPGVEGAGVDGFTNRYLDHAGRYRSLAWDSQADPEEGLVFGIARDVTEQLGDQELERTQREILESMLLGDELHVVLTRIVQAMEARFPGLVVSLRVRDPSQQRVERLVAPSLTGDTTDDDARHAVAWSLPCASGSGELLGTLAVHGRDAGEPSQRERDVAEGLARLTSLVVEQSELRARLVESEERFRLVSQVTSDAVYDWDLATGVLWWSEGIEQLFGYPWTGTHATVDDWLGCIVDQDRDAVAAEMYRAIDGGADRWEAEYRFLRADDTVAFVLERGSIVRDDTGQAVRMIGGLIDQTERRELEQQYLRAQRVESVGSLAGGMAHDLNNVFAPIVLAADLLQREQLTPIGDGARETILTSARRGADMVRQVLSFAKGLDRGRGVIDVPGLLAELERLVGDSVGAGVEVVFDVTDDVWAVRGDATQLQQVLLNLVINARDAMPEGGTLTIKAGNVEVDALQAAARGARGGPEVAVSVQDTGTGMTEDVLEQIFDPFFTTKPGTAGTGLGLSTARSIVRNHDGSLEVASRPGVGTTFTLHLPAVGDISATSTTAKDPSPPAGQGQRLLVVDDEAAVRTITQQTLESHGYRVLTAADGAAALSRFTDTDDQIDLVVCDLMMPVMDGVTTIRGIRRLDPELPIIAISGLAGEENRRRAAEAGASEVLEKPFSTEVLLMAVATAMEPRPDREA